MGRARGVFALGALALGACAQILGLSDLDADGESAGSGGTARGGAESGGAESGGAAASDGGGAESGGAAASESGGAAGSVGSGGQTAQPPGSSCSEPGECEDGLCVDGVCCQSACDGVCESCAVSGEEGSCTPFLEGTDPEDECMGLTCSGVSACVACDNGVLDGDETDVDCGGSCLACPGGLLITEVVDNTTSQEYVEIHNPGAEEVTLEHVYLSDHNEYFQVTVGISVPSVNDFTVHFPPGSSIAPGEYLTISTRSSGEFLGNYGFYPDYDMSEADATAPAMLGGYTSSTTVNSTGEAMVLFFWDGSSALVRDIDYVVWEPAPVVLGDTEIIDKSGQTVNGETYLNETPQGLQSIAPDPDPSVNPGEALVRCDLSEGTEVQTGGNGFSGQDETSENLAATWALTLTRTPGAANNCE